MAERGASGDRRMSTGRGGVTVADVLIYKKYPIRFVKSTINSFECISVDGTFLKLPG